MKNMIKSLAVLTAVIGLAASAYAGECCTKAAAAAKAGKTCEKCEKDACCKEADFNLKSLDDQTVRLSELTAKGNVVLVVLRGWPGYQCPICDRQVQDFIRLKSDFAEAKAGLSSSIPARRTA